VTTAETADQVIGAALAAAEVTSERTEPGRYLVTLPGQHKLATMCWLIAGEHALLVEAFVMRAPEENREEVYAFVLRRNGRLYGVAYALDGNGDVYLVGRIPLHAVTADEVDRLLGSVLSYADEDFDRLLELGYGDAIRREWAWRVKRGEPLHNLAAFARFADPDRRH
jgi:hypothetical protein